MHAGIKQWQERLDEVTTLFDSTFGTWSSEQLNWKPAPEVWSVAQNIEHLIVVNESYYPAVESLRAGRYVVPFMGRFGFMRRFFGNFILKSVMPDRKRRMKTFPVWDPGSSDVQGDILGRFRQHQANFSKFIADCSDLLEKDAVISSPANQNIVYTLEAAFDIITEHEMRHFRQAQELSGMVK